MDDNNVLNKTFEDQKPCDKCAAQEALEFSHFMGKIEGSQTLVTDNTDRVAQRADCITQVSPTFVHNKLKNEQDRLFSTSFFFQEKI